MRILELHSPLFRGIWRREHEVISWGCHAECDLRAPAEGTDLRDVLAALPAGWHPDLIVFADDCLLLRVTGLEAAPCPLVLLSLDAHHNAGWHAPMAPGFDWVFVAQRDLLPLYHAAGAREARWLPYWAPDDLPEPRPEKRYDVSFVGSLDPRLHGERVEFLNALSSRIPLHVAEGDYRDVFASSRIVLNQTVKGDLNMRVFEAMGCGALLLTERSGNGLLELFTDGADLVTYPRGDVDAVVEQVERLLAEPAVGAAMAARGREQVLDAHCARHRAAEVLTTVGPPRARRARAERYGAFGRAYCLLADYAARVVQVAEAYAEELRVLRRRYLDAALAAATAPACEEQDRNAILGMVALERGDLPLALIHLERAVAGPTACREDYLVHIEALVRSGCLGAARTAAEELLARHPGYELGREIATGLGVSAAP